MKALRAESGYGLLLVLLLMLGAGGVVLAGFTQQVKQEAEEERYQHNQRVLQEAKQALLMYAYNYPDNNPGRGPGRLPCPDTDNPGAAGAGMPNSSFNCINGNAMIGRFPWLDPELNFYDARDASGERLWYAVSRNFANTISPTNADVINSNTTGTITLVDRSGRILYDGSETGIDADGVAAVIIAPGTVLRRDENGDGVYEYSQVRGTAAQQGDPRNYLDTFGNFDNSVFNNDQSDTDDDGFILGPVFDIDVSDTVVNDQFIIVTAAEVLQMAEKKVLETYRDAIRAYLNRTGGVYPWLYSYNDIDYVPPGEPVSVAIDKLSTFFPAKTPFTNEKTNNLGIDPDPTKVPPRGHMGRIPSTFGPYFTEGDSRPIESRLVNIELTLMDPGVSATFPITEKTCNTCPGESDDVTTFYSDPVNGGPTLSFDISQVLTDVKFVDVNPAIVDGRGRLSVNFNSAESIGPIDVYFWDGDNDDRGYYNVCPAGADELLDCSRDSGGNQNPGGPLGKNTRIMHMEVYIDFDGTEEFEFDYSTPLPDPVLPDTANPKITAANGASHATITATFAAANVVSFPGTIRADYEYERHWHPGDPEINLETGNNTYATGTVDLSSVTIRSLKISMRYYPEIPVWGYSNRWHDYIRMAYAQEFEPPGTGPCVDGTTCMELADSPGSPQVTALLVISGKGEWRDLDLNGKLKNDLGSVFDPSNENFNKTFYKHKGNDKLMVID